MTFVIFPLSYPFLFIKLSYKIHSENELKLKEKLFGDLGIETGSRSGVDSFM